ncbi:hypothetical protein [Salininema proteolyticum]|uniref:Uncharacterized protein n=1 Tax=Salininema proteolyticum TaxID=1607685 RepID=A0ABV8TUA4_9ACTN
MDTERGSAALGLEVRLPSQRTGGNVAIREVDGESAGRPAAGPGGATAGRPVDVDWKSAEKGDGRAGDVSPPARGLPGTGAGGKNAGPSAGSLLFTLAAPSREPVPFPFPVSAPADGSAAFGEGTALSGDTALDETVTSGGAPSPASALLLGDGGAPGTEVPGESGRSELDGFSLPPITTEHATTPGAVSRDETTDGGVAVAPPAPAVTFEATVLLDAVEPGKVDRAGRGRIYVGRHRRRRPLWYRIVTRSLVEESALAVFSDGASLVPGKA